MAQPQMCLQLWAARTGAQPCTPSCPRLLAGGCTANEPNQQPQQLVAAKIRGFVDVHLKGKAKAAAGGRRALLGRGGDDTLLWALSALGSSFPVSAPTQIGVAVARAAAEIQLPTAASITPARPQQGTTHRGWLCTNGAQTRPGPRTQPSGPPSFTGIVGCGLVPGVSPRPPGQTNGHCPSAWPGQTGEWEGLLGSVAWAIPPPRSGHPSLKQKGGGKRTASTQRRDTTAPPMSRARPLPKHRRCHPAAPAPAPTQLPCHGMASCHVIPDTPAAAGSDPCRTAAPLGEPGPAHFPDGGHRSWTGTAPTGATRGMWPSPSFARRCPPPQALVHASATGRQHKAQREALLCQQPLGTEQQEPVGPHAAAPLAAQLAEQKQRPALPSPIRLLPFPLPCRARTPAPGLD